MATDYYEVLGVTRTASQSEIEDAYRERVKETHPDLNEADDAADRFKRVKEAHETLGDPDERARYDRLGHGSYTSFGFGEDGGAGPGGTDGFDVGDVDGFGFDVGFDDGDGSDFDFGSDPYASTETADGERTYDVSGPGWSDSGWSDGTDRDRDRDIFETAARERRSENRRHVRDDGSGEAESQTDGGFTVHQWGDDPVEKGGEGLRITQDRAVVASIVFILYPVFLYSSVTPQFSTATNVIVGVCTLLTMGYLMTLPELGLVVFGAWSVLAPLFMLVMAPLSPFSLLGVFVLAVCWIPFGYSLMVAKVTRW